MLNALFKHRSIRKFKDHPVEMELLKNILEAGTRASTTGNMQVYCMIITTSPDLKQHLWEAHFKQEMVLRAPVHITFCADFNRFNKWCLQRNARPGYDNVLSFLTAATDALLVSQNVAMAAESEGLGICYLGTVIYNADKIIDILGLPKLVVPVAAMVLGYPDEDPPLTDRLPLESVVHYERYADFTPDKITTIYKEREGSSFTAELLKQNNRQTLAQIFTDIRYTRENNLLFSGKFMKVLERQGFNP